MVTRMTVVATAAACAALSGCAALVPNTVTPFAEHVSHLTQHEPFCAADRQAHIGYEEVGVAARWDYRAAFVEVAEGYNFASKEGQACAGLCGEREVFSARVGYSFRLK